MADNAEYKEAFALFDKRGTGFVPREQIGDLLRALGQNPTQGEVAELASNAPREVDYKTFLAILNRPDGFKPAGTPGTRVLLGCARELTWQMFRGIHSWFPSV
ncbi:hypothetical protein FRC08_002431 [Ceratobasidium sp. 394]|nr:hypothetical protein FRC08_002431 [Ceratobasidium sp. 394]